MNSNWSYFTKRFRGRGSLAAFRNDCCGQVLWLFALLIPFFAAFLGLSLDVGRFYHLKRQMQTAADAGAMGGAHELWRRNLTQVETAAKADTRFNSFNDDAPDVSVTVNNPPASGAYAGNAGFVEVIVEQQAIETFFMRYFTPGQVTVRARAVAGLVPGTDGCILALDPDERAALKVNGGAVLNASCGVMVNSTDDKAVMVDGGGCIYAEPSGVAVSGGFVMNGSANCVYPAPDAETPPAMDPLTYLSAPAVPETVLAPNGLKLTGVSASLLTDPDLTNVIESVNLLAQKVTVKPGLYTGGIDISGSGYTVEFAAGTYVIDAGDLRISGNLTVIGTGVTFYIINTTGVLGQWGYVYIGGGVTAQFSAPTDGPYAGMLFWHTGPDRNPGSVIAGNEQSRFVGTMYFPYSHLDFTGTSDSQAWSIIVANTINIAGSSTMNNNYLNSAVPLPTRKVTLVE